MDTAATALLFDRDAVEEVEDWSERLGGLGRSSILWIDLKRPDEGQIREVADALELAKTSAGRLVDPESTPFFGDFGTYVHVTAYAPATRDASTELERVTCLVSKRWVVTVHDGEVPVLETFRERAGGSGDTGRIEGLQFLANLLEWVLEGYLEAFEGIEVALEEIDARAMGGQLENQQDVVEQLVEHRQRIGRLRRALVSHRTMLLSLARPELGGMSRQEDADRFTELRVRLEEAVQAARDSRDAVVGSFDVLIAQTGYRTNEIMKVLTLASVLLLPGALIAGVLGMNFEVGLFEHTGLFWVVVALIVAMAAATVAVARARSWI
ncbi:MAG: magnesium transporter CorA family protein [Gaiellaceae bacterium]